MQAFPSPLTCYPIRLLPKQEIKQSLKEFVQKHGLQAAFVLTCCGSVTRAKLRMADSLTPYAVHENWSINKTCDVTTMQGLYSRNFLSPKKFIKEMVGPFEIVSLVGTVSGGSGGHLHASLSDSSGNVIGGHVVGDLVVYTTAEIVIGECTGSKFTREDDLETGYEELVVTKR